MRKGPVSKQHATLSAFRKKNSAGQPSLRCNSKCDASVSEVQPASLNLPHENSQTYTRQEGATHVSLSFSGWNALFFFFPPDKVSGLYAYRKRRCRRGWMKSTADASIVSWASIWANGLASGLLVTIGQSRVAQFKARILSSCNPRTRHVNLLNGQVWFGASGTNIMYFSLRDTVDMLTND